MTKEEPDKENAFPVRLPKRLIKMMDAFIKDHPEIAIVSRQELARRAVSEWLLEKEKELREGTAAKEVEKKIRKKRKS